MPCTTCRAKLSCAGLQLLRLTEQQHSWCICLPREPPEAKDSCAQGQVGDASASQSPLSFGGFGNMLRHLERLSTGLDAALQQDRLSKQALRLLQARQLPLPAQALQLLHETL